MELINSTTIARADGTTYATVEYPDQGARLTVTEDALNRQELLELAAILQDMAGRVWRVGCISLKDREEVKRMDKETHKVLIQEDHGTYGSTKEFCMESQEQSVAAEIAALLGRKPKKVIFAFEEREGAECGFNPKSKQNI